MTTKQIFEKLSSAARVLMGTILLLAVSACSTPEEMMQEHYENGLELLEEGDLVKANIEFRNALQIDESFIPAWEALSHIEEDKKAWVSLNSILNRIVELDPANIDANVRLGKLMLMVDQLDRAVEISEAILLVDNQNADVLAFRAAVLLKLGDTESALETANRSLEIEPGNISAIQILAAERFTQRDFDGALNYINQSNEEISENKDLMLISITIFEAKGDIENAERYYQQLAASFPDDENVRTGLVRFYIKHNNVDAAEEEIRNIASTDPTNYEKSMDIVRFLNSYRGRTAAEEELNALIQRGTDVVRYQLALAEFYMTLNERDSAVDVLNKIVDRTGSSEDGLTARGRLGELAMAEDRLEDAEAIVAEILEIDPANLIALEIRGSLNLEAERYDNAIQDLRIVLNEKPDSQRASLLLSRAYELTGSIELADDTLADALRYSENSAEVAIAYANFLIKQSSVPRAEDVVMSVLEVQPNNVGLLQMLARIRLMRQNWIGAQQVAEAIRELDSEGGFATEISGLALSGQQNYEDSIAAFQNAYQSGTGSSNALSSLIGSYMRSGQTEEARRFLNGVLEENENNYQALILLGQVQLSVNENEQALDTFEKAISADPQNATAYMNLVGYHARLGDLETALAVADRGIDVVDNNLGLYLVKAGIYEREQDYEMAISIYEDLLEGDNANDVVVNNLASLLSEHRSDDASLQRAQELAARFRQSSIPHFKDTLGWIYYKVGDIQSATSILQDAVEQIPTMAIFRYHLGMAYLAGERNSAAIREFEEVVKISEERPFEQIEEVKSLLADLNTPS